MLSFPPTVRIFVAREPADMRKAFDGLAGIVRGAMAEDPLDGHLYVFFNRQRDRAKILWWDGSGFMLLAKRLEAGRFALPELATTATGRASRISSAELALVLEGIDLRDARRQKRFHRPVA